MNSLLPFIVSGIASGAIYGMSATGLVLTYKTSGIFNFGYGALATVAACVFYSLHVSLGVSWPLALVVSVGVVGPAMGLAMAGLARHLGPRNTSDKIVATVGLVVLVEGAATVIYGPDVIPVSPYLPHATDTFEVGGVYITYQQVIMAGIGIFAVSALYLLFRYSRLGVAMRAVVDDPDLAELHGTDTTTVRRIAWIIGSTLAALSGVLLVPLIGLQALSLTLIATQAFAAAAIGAFSSFPLAFLGGAVVGIAANVSTNYVLSFSWLSGFPSSVPFIVLIVALLVIPRRKLIPPSAALAAPRPLHYEARPVVRIYVGAIAVAVMCVVPAIAGTHLVAYTVGLTQILLMLSLGLLVRTSGQVSLCHTTFAAIGAVTFSQLAVDHGWPWFLALLGAAVVAIPVGAILAFPAIRLHGIFLALITFGFGIMVQELLFPLGAMFSTLNDGRAIPRPSFAASDNSYYYLVLVFVVVFSLFIVWIHQSRLGRILRGLSEAPAAVSVLGLTTNITRTIVFCLSASIAAISGVLYGGEVHFATASDPQYLAFTSLTLIALLALSPFREPWFALFAGIASIVPSYLNGADVDSYLNILFGLFAIIVAIQGQAPMPVWLQRRIERAFPSRRAAGEARAAAAAEAPVAAAELPRAAAEAPAAAAEAFAAVGRSGSGSARATGLRVAGLSVRFGGVTAVREVSLVADLGQVTGLVGPNGAGKTTLFNACSGLNKPTSGRIDLRGRDITGWSSAHRARLGLGRTFQRMELGDNLTVLANVMLGYEARRAGGRVATQLVEQPGDSRRMRSAAADALELCGIGDLRDRQAGTLSTGQRRLVEFARCLAGSFHMLLLDEPSSGLDRSETALFGEILMRAVRERGCGVLLVEHDMSLVLRVCSQIYVLNFGEMIFLGGPDAVVNSPEVQAAYLGDNAHQFASGASDVRKEVT
jgi:ABC-type branched-subunit amino acid transport system ATPase component/branched-subunit amino acid ABC-type transport system permease component